ncbi:MAG: SCP2 sterol-binding domain-containing protein [Deltaproteobacteria bacterium]
MSKFPFLSDGWLDAVIALQGEYGGQLPPASIKMKMNQIVNGMPFGDATLHFHLDSSTGEGRLGKGHVEVADVTVTTDYETARALVVEPDQAAAMQAFMSGRIKVAGDMTKIMTPQPPKNDAQKELDQKIQDLTE